MWQFKSYPRYRYLCSFPKVGCDVSAREICIFGVPTAKNASLLSPSHSKTPTLALHDAQNSDVAATA